MVVTNDWVRRQHRESTGVTFDGYHGRGGNLSRPDDPTNRWPSDKSLDTSDDSTQEKRTVVGLCRKTNVPSFNLFKDGNIPDVFLSIVKTYTESFWKKNEVK